MQEEGEQQVLEAHQGQVEPARQAQLAAEDAVRQAREALAGRPDRAQPRAEGLLQEQAGRERQQQDHQPGRDGSSRTRPTPASASGRSAPRSAGSPRRRAAARRRSGPPRGAPPSSRTGSRWPRITARVSELDGEAPRVGWSRAGALGGRRSGVQLHGRHRLDLLHISGPTCPLDRQGRRAVLWTSRSTYLFRGEFDP